ncbi:hypothetical protein FOA52_001936 [Chlamydomonas sp. UWO 241]|nr:hypothetical protein FOA52_001936 [Chlamydomonas sp. UWO 241]
MQALRQQIEAYASGLAKKAAAVEAARAKLAGWPARAAVLGAEIEAKQAEVDAARATNAAAVSANSERLAEAARARQLEDQLAMEAAEAKMVAAGTLERPRMMAPEEHPAGVDDGSGGGGGDGAAAAMEDPAAAGAATEDPAVAAAAAATEDPAAAAATTVVEEGEESVEERGRRIASQWTADPEAAGQAAPQHAGAADGDAPYDQYDHEYDHDGGDDDHAHESYVDNEEDEDEGAAGGAWSKEVDDAREALHNAEYDLRLLAKERDEIEAFGGGGLDWGPGDVFFALAGRCLTDYAGSYTYEACFYANASQSQSRGAKTSIGTWAGWGADYTSAEFVGGDECGGDAPARSLRVHLTCAETERLYGSSEPSTCAYVAWLQTPLACGADGAAALEAQLQEIVDARAELQREIDAEDAAAAAAAAATGAGGKDEL